MEQWTKKIDNQMCLLAALIPGYKVITSIVRSVGQIVTPSLVSCASYLIKLQLKSKSEKFAKKMKIFALHSEHGPEDFPTIF